MIILLLFIPVLIYGMITAKITHVDMVNLYSKDVPPEFEGFRILFISDLDIKDRNDAEDFLDLLKTMDNYHPDMLALGGDYVLFNSKGDMTETRKYLFNSLASKYYPNGVYLVRGDGDLYAPIENDMPEALCYLNEDGRYIKKGDAKIAICGFDSCAPSYSDYGELTGKIKKDDFAIALTHSPIVISGLLSSGGKDNGAWCDLMLAGHTHGGQIKIGDHTIRALTPEEKRYKTGDSENGAQIIISDGLGLDKFPMRIGTRSQVHLITLHTYMSGE